MARYRLRFLLQELDLPAGDTVIGRSPACGITIEDPLVSRHHARISVAANDAVFEDLGSRNGSRVNGGIARERVALRDGDRIRIGTVELVFCRVATVPLAAGKVTGFLCHCSSCHLPYPEEMASCPHCGSNERDDDDTLAGGVGDSRQSWTLQLLAEVLAKALALGRVADADRLLRRTMTVVDERLALGAPVDAQQLDSVAASAVTLAAMQAGSHWPAWVLDVCLRAQLLPASALLERMGELPAAGTLRHRLDALATARRTGHAGADIADREAALAALRARLAPG